jgi:hypothetical protein
VVGPGDHHFGRRSLTSGNGNPRSRAWRHLQRNYDTRLQGWLAVSAGAVLVGAGVGILLWRGHHERLSLRLSELVRRRSDVLTRATGTTAT